MDDRTKAIDEKITACDVEIKQYMANMKGGRGQSSMAKNRAMQALKRKKMYENQREQILGQQFNIDQMVFNTENMQAQIETVGAMKEANTAMKGQMKQLNLGEVEDLHDDMAELFEDMEEINDLMGRNYACPDIDQSELDDEFAMLEGELALEAEMQALNGGIPAYVPDAPQASASAPSAEQTNTIDA